MSKIASFVLPVRVHYCQCRGQGFAAKVVIENEHIGGAGGGDSFVRQRSTVDADDQIVIGGQRLHGRDVGAVALVDPVRDIKRRVPAHLAKPHKKLRGRGPAINVVIGEYRDPFSGLDSLNEAGRGWLHIAQCQGIGKEIA